MQLVKKSSFKKRSQIQIWFLDEDINVSAKYQTNDTLEKSIDGCISALISARMYFVGIRSQKFYKYYFNEENKQNTIDKLFHSWPYSKNPSFKNYKSITSKWCRMCNEHYQFITLYLEALLNEYEYRHSKIHKDYKFYEWNTVVNPLCKIPNGNIKKILFPWKCLWTKWRRKNIVEGYRLQFLNTCIDDNDAFKAYSTSNRDIPSFVIQYYNLNISGIC